MSTMERTVKDFPQPGPPVSTDTGVVSAIRTAASCSGASSTALSKTGSGPAAHGRRVESRVAAARRRSTRAATAVSAACSAGANTAGFHRRSRPGRS